MNRPNDDEKPLPPENGGNTSAEGSGGKPSGSASPEGSSGQGTGDAAGGSSAADTGSGSEDVGNSAAEETAGADATVSPAGADAQGAAEPATGGVGSLPADAAGKPAAEAVTDRATGGASRAVGEASAARPRSGKAAVASAAAADDPEDEAAGEEDADEWEDDDTKPSGSILPADFWSHVEDLRWVLLKSILTFLGTTLLMMLFSVKAQKLLAWPLQYGLHLSGSEMADIQLRTDGPFSVFTFMLQLWVFGGLLLSLPFMLYFASSFIAPGLTAKEKKMLRPVAFSALGLFLVGCGFAFFLLLPTYIAVSLSLEQMFGFASLWTPANYYGAVVWTTLGMGVVFQFPLVLIMLQVLGLISADTLKKFRRHSFVFILIFAALLTPGGDPITLAVCALPLYGLYELAILLGERIRRRAAARAETYEDEYY